MKKMPQERYAAEIRAFAILTKLGGKHFVQITGAHRFEALDNGILFGLPNHIAKHGINRVKIRENDHNTYDFRFIKVDKEKYMHEDMIAVENVNEESLQTVFSDMTGLLLSL